MEHEKEDEETGAAERKLQKNELAHSVKGSDKDYEEKLEKDSHEDDGMGEICKVDVEAADHTGTVYR